MTLFLNIPDLASGIKQAESVFSNNGSYDEEQQIANLMRILDPMLEFAKTQEQEILALLGFDSIEALNNALQRYNDTDISYAELFPAFSGATMSSILAEYGIGKTSGAEPQYDLVASAIEDAIRDRFPEYVEGKINSSEILTQLQDERIAASIGVDAVTRMFLGQPLQMNMQIDLRTGIMYGDFINAFDKIRRELNKWRNGSGTQSKTAKKLIENLMIPLIQQMGKDNLLQEMDSQNLIDYSKTIAKIKEFIPDTKKLSTEQKFIKTTLTERIQRGKLRTKTNIQTKIEDTNDGVLITFYNDPTVIGVDKSIFDIEARDKANKESIEAYVERRCNEVPELRGKLTTAIKKFYWGIIQSKLPQNQATPIIETRYNQIIEEMCAPTNEKGNIGWFFSQSTTKAGGAGMFGEIIAMIYMAILCPGLVTQWAGGTQSASNVKPPADIIINAAGKQYGVQVKNYTSGETLTHDYNLSIKNMLNSVAKETIANQDLMTKQMLSELNANGMGITQEEIEEVQNIIIANSFNVPWKRIKEDEFIHTDYRKNFTSIRAQLDQAFLRATRYMALASIIMHRVQYQENVNRWVKTSTFEEKQLQNTLWLVNGAFFVSAFQILTELESYIRNIMNTYFSLSAKNDKFTLSDMDTGFFNVSSSTSLSGSKNNPLPKGLSEGRFTIVEYFNANPELQKSSLSYISGRISTNYHMSSFHR